MFSIIWTLAPTQATAVYWVTKSPGLAISNAKSLARSWAAPAARASRWAVEAASGTGDVPGIGEISPAGTGTSSATAIGAAGAGSVAGSSADGLAEAADPANAARRSGWRLG